MWQYNHLQPNELMHYGKKGMKWGKRNSKRSFAESENNSAHRLAGAYTNAMDKRVLKKPDSLSRKSEANSAHKLADKYTNAMDKKLVKSANKPDHTKRNVALGLAALAAIGTVSIVAAKSGANVSTGQNFVKNFDFNKVRIYGPSNIDKNLAFNIAKVNGPSNMAKNLAFNVARSR